MASLNLSSRFGVLKVQDTLNRDTRRPQNKPKKTNEGKSESSAASENAKKRARKKKRQQQLQSERDELRGMTFMQKGGSSGHGQSHPPPQPEQTKPPEKKPTGNEHNHGNQPSEAWKHRDEELLDNKFEEDLQKALLESRIVFEERQTVLSAVTDPLPETTDKKEDGSKKDRKSQKRDKQHAMSLQEFLSTGEPPAGVGLDDIPIEEVSATPEIPDKDETFFKDIEKEATVIIRKDNQKRRNHSSSQLPPDSEDAGEVIRSLQFKEKLQKKDEEIEQLKEELLKQKNELSQVKKRNKQLCVILAQGEMKDKAEVLKQLEELTSVKDELTQEVQELHSALEQERSKVSSLKTELQKLQEKKR